LCFRCLGPDRTRQCARALAQVIGERGLVVSLEGPLGAGKTVFVKGLAEGLGMDPATVSSPSFVIVNQYSARAGGQLAHVDLYRVESERELEDAGFLDLLEPGAVVAVEWGDRFPEALPGDRLELRFARVPSEDSRRISDRPPSPSGEADAASASDLRVIEAQARGRESAAALEAWRRSALSAGGVEPEQGE